jgi:hypothetical protein
LQGRTKAACRKEAAWLVPEAGGRGWGVKRPVFATINELPVMVKNEMNPFRKMIYSNRLRKHDNATRKSVFPEGKRTYLSEISMGDSIKAWKEPMPAVTAESRTNVRLKKHLVRK